jgi:hypothetical protein
MRSVSTIVNCVERIAAELCVEQCHAKNHRSFGRVRVDGREVIPEIVATLQRTEIFIADYFRRVRLAWTAQRLSMATLWRWYRGLGFIGVIRHVLKHSAHHRALHANCAALAVALAFTQSHRPSAHAMYPGNRPRNVRLKDALDPNCFGMLLAYYEHKIFV